MNDEFVVTITGNPKSRIVKIENGRKGYTLTNAEIVYSRDTERDIAAEDSAADGWVRWTKSNRLVLTVSGDVIDEP